MSIDRAAFPFAATIAVAAALAALWTPWACLPFVLSFGFILWFFRDPDRSIPVDPTSIVSPADGKIIKAEPDRVSVFMNVFDVHVCRTPIPGRLTAVLHTPGRFLAAFRDTASEHNERTRLTVRGEAGTVTFTLVAGLIARRIVCRVAEGEDLVAGQRVGLIRFGSRVDVDLPQGSTVLVEPGQRVVGGRSIIARLTPSAKQESGPGG